MSDKLVHIKPDIKPEIDITTILVSYNTAALLADAIDALRIAAGSISLQTIIIDNASRDDSVALIRRDYSDCKLIVNTKNVGFGRANNQALPLIQGRYILLLNTDAFIASDSLLKTVAYMEAHSECGALGVKLIGRDGVLQPSCRHFPTPLNIFLRSTGLQRLFPWVKLVDDMDWDHASTRACDWVPGCYFLIRREVVDKVGLFDPRYFLYYEEVDLCFAIKQAGWQIHYFPDTTVIHVGGESAKADGLLSAAGRQLTMFQIESELLYFRKNYGAATAWLSVLLRTLADFIVPFKQMLKCHKKVGWVNYWAHTRLYWVLFFQTKFGIKPTR